ncbi:phosphodiester glycosidase family protein [Oceanobacillus saliphilus]|uniref:phosphodiester glycosidase family protein n=1 Tax=Oceanobacillus saliphilus TaxID=2925834 RepID=UPI00201D5F79|nr:phosphodiester glycosidase family protein [Oceanobacillus saliphilus]
MNRKWISGIFAILLIISSVIPVPVVHAKDNPVADARSASSDKTEPIITVGPAGKTIVSSEETTMIGPGIELTHFERFDARGWLNGEVMTVDLANEAVSTDLLYPGVITDSKPLSEMAKQSGAVGGVNGDFFDINNTKAPSGTMIEDGSLLKGPQGSHTLTAGVNEHGIGDITSVFLEGIVQMPSGERPLAALNQSSIPSNGIGVYTSVWGEAQRANAGSYIYEVTVQDGKVAAVSNEVGRGAIEENIFVLVGRETGAELLKELSVGDEVKVSYTPKIDGDAFMNFAIGGNTILVENGQVPANVDDNLTAPRTAVGFSEDGKTMILGLIDGRQVDSRGMTYKEMGELMKEYGAYQALNLDGGGSSTMVARMPGETDANIVNNPSDGTERYVPNGIGVFAEAGSGELTNFAVETVVKGDNSYRVFPGLGRSFIGLGHDENYFPVNVEGIRWQALPADVGSFDENGVFYAKKSGSAVAQAQIQSVKGTKDITVLGELDRLETSQSYLGLEMGRNGIFSVIGYDKDGYAAPIESRDLKLDYDDSIISLEENHNGTFSVEPKQDGTSALITISVKDKRVELPVSIGMETVLVSDFEEADEWRFSSARGSGSLGTAEGQEGNGLEVNYDFSLSTGTRTANAHPVSTIMLPGEPRKIGMSVKGEGKGEWMSFTLRDAAGTFYYLYGPYATWTGWEYIEMNIPEGVQYPLELRTIGAIETSASKQYTGQLVYDNLVVEVPPSVEMPEKEVSKPDPLIVQNDSIGENRWKFAMLADSQFVASSPNSRQVQMARESLREIVAENPEFIVINGDLVDTAWVEDFELAKQILEEEVGDIPVYYIPGNHEIQGPGTLDNFLDVFEENRYSFDHNGTRFILLDTSTGSYRISDFDQLIELKQSLNDAATDPTINNVVVVGHHPTRDPLPTKNSQLSDQKEAALMENWLTEFRETSNGKGAIYISGHAHMVHLERVEGVPYLIVGSSGKAPYGTPDNGGFYAWTMFGIDPTPVPDHAFGPENGAEQSTVRDSDWIEVEVRPILDSITINAPETIKAGETDDIIATGHQAGNLNFPLSYPASVNWEGSDNVFIGSGDKLERAKKSNKYAAVYNPSTGELTALTSGEISLKVISNKVEAVHGLVIE